MSLNTEQDVEIEYLDGNRRFPLSIKVGDHVLRFTKHARERMELRKISVGDVLRRIHGVSFNRWRERGVGARPIDSQNLTGWVICSVWNPGKLNPKKEVSGVRTH